MGAAPTPMKATPARTVPKIPAFLLLIGVPRIIDRLTDLCRIHGMQLATPFE
jgi:hypothetical protein